MSGRSLSRTPVHRQQPILRSLLCAELRARGTTRDARMNPHDDLRTERCQEPGAWLGAPGSDMAALPDGLWVRPAQSRVHPEAAWTWLEHGSAARGVGTVPAPCFLAGVSLSPASLVCKMGATTHHRGAAGRAAAPPQCWSLSPDRLHGHWCPRLVQSLAKILSLFSLRYRLLLSSVPFSDF